MSALAVVAAAVLVVTGCDAGSNKATRSSAGSNVASGAPPASDAAAAPQDTAASSKLALRDQVTELLPKELVSLDETATKQELRDRFKDKLLPQKDHADAALFLHYFSTTNDVTIGLKDDHLDYVYVEVTPDLRSKGAELFDSAMASLTEEEKTTFEQDLRNQRGHEAGRFVTVKVPRQKLTLQFYGNEARELHSVILRPVSAVDGHR